MFAETVETPQKRKVWENFSFFQTVNYFPSEALYYQNPRIHHDPVSESSEKYPGQMESQLCTAHLLAS
jgi:hypothetical protein